MVLLERFRHLLKLRQRNVHLEDELIGMKEPDWLDQATDRIGVDTVSALDEAQRRELLAVHAALGRIVAGTYGKCAVCGKTIERERLKVIPWATLCAEDSAAREAEAGARVTQE